MTTLARQCSQKDLAKRVQEQDHKCVCEICSCGKHRCPPRHLEFNAETSNQHFYKPYNISVEKTKKTGYTINQSHYDPQLLKSTYRANYKPFHCQPIHYQQKYAYQPNKNKFYAETQYKKSYTPHEILVEHAQKCEDHYERSRARFDGTTTYGVEFRPKHVQQPQVKVHYAYQPNKLPFDAHTTYGDNFRKFQIVAERPRTCCESRYQRTNARFEGKSSYQTDYRGLQGERGCRCLVEQLPPRPRQCSPGQEHIHFCAHDCKWE